MLMRCDDARPFASDPVAVVVGCCLSISTSCVYRPRILTPGTAPATGRPGRSIVAVINGKKRRRFEGGRRRENAWLVSVS